MLAFQPINRTLKDYWVFFRSEEDDLSGNVTPVLINAAADVLEAVDTAMAELLALEPERQWVVVQVTPMDGTLN